MLRRLARACTRVKTYVKTKLSTWNYTLTGKCYGYKEKYITKIIWSFKLCNLMDAIHTTCVKFLYKFENNLSSKLKSKVSSKSRHEICNKWNIKDKNVFNWNWKVLFVNKQTQYKYISFQLTLDWYLFCTYTYSIARKILNLRLISLKIF